MVRMAIVMMMMAMVMMGPELRTRPRDDCQCEHAFILKMARFSWFTLEHDKIDLGHLSANICTFYIQFVASLYLALKLLKRPE